MDHHTVTALVQIMEPASVPEYIVLDAFVGYEVLGVLEGQQIGCREHRDH